MKRYFHPGFRINRLPAAERCFLPYPDGLALAQADGDVINVLDMLTEGVPALCVEESDSQGALSVLVEVPKLADALLQVENQEPQDPSRLQRVVEEWANWADAAVALRMLAPASVELTWATNEPATTPLAASEALLYQLCARSNRLSATMSDLRAVGLVSPLQYDSDTAIELWAESEAEVRTIFNTNAEKVQTLGADNELLLLQIAQLQEELEFYFTKVKETEDAKAVYSEVETAPNLSMARALISRLFKAETSVAES